MTALTAAPEFSCVHTCVCVGACVRAHVNERAADDDDDGVSEQPFMQAHTESVKATARSYPEGLK